MLSQSRGLRLALVLLMSLGYVAWHGHHQVAYAQGDDDDDGEDDDGGDGGDEEEPEEPEEPDEDQPPVTAGGLFTLKTYPVRELSRPLTITEKIVQARVGLGVDVSAKGAFESFGLSLDGKYGFRDNVMGLAGFTNAYNFKQFAVYGGIETALAYDLVDWRAAFRVGRTASQDITTGETAKGKIKAAIDIGFPFRYVAKPEIAIVALDTLISFDLNDAGEDIDDGMGGTISVGNRIKPDLNPSLGIATNPIPALSIVIFAQLQIVDFDTTNQFTVPATARVQFSPNQKLDIGAEFTLKDVKAEEGKFDQRFLTLYVQFRAGK